MCAIASFTRSGNVVGGSPGSPSALRAILCASLSCSPRAYVKRRSRAPPRCRTWKPIDAAPPGRSQTCCNGTSGSIRSRSSRTCTRECATGISSGSTPSIGPRIHASVALMMSSVRASRLHVFQGNQGLQAEVASHGRADWINSSDRDRRPACAPDDSADCTARGPGARGFCRGIHGDRPLDRRHRIGTRQPRRKQTAACAAARVSHPARRSSQHGGASRAHR